MPSNYSSLFDIKYTRNGNGDLIARVASNDAFKTSSFKLNLGDMVTQDAAAVLESFVKPFVLMPETSVMRQTHRLAHDSLFMPEIEIDFTSISRNSAGATVWEGSLQRECRIIDSAGRKVTIGIPTDLLFNKPPKILIDTNRLSFAKLGNAVGGFLGSKLASELVSFGSVGGQLGAAVGSVIGSIVATSALVAGTGASATLAGVQLSALAGTFASMGAIGGPLGAARFICANDNAAPSLRLAA